MSFFLCLAVTYLSLSLRSTSQWCLFFSLILLRMASLFLFSSSDDKWKQRQIVDLAALLPSMEGMQIELVQFWIDNDEKYDDISEDNGITVIITNIIQHNTMLNILYRMYRFSNNPRNPKYSKLYSPDHYANLVKEEGHTLSKSTQLLLELYGQKRMTFSKFEVIWKKYAYYAVQASQKPSKSIREKLQWLDVATKIQHRFKTFTSQHLTKAFNRMQAECWKEAVDTKNTPNALKIILITSHYNPKKATALFLSQAQAICKYLPQATIDFPLMVIQVFVNCKIHHSLLRQLTLDALYPQLDHLNAYQFSIVTSYISWTPQYINKEFLKKAAIKLTHIFKSNNISDYDLIRALAGIANVEVRDNLSNVYLPEIDKCVDTILPYLSSKLVEFNLGNLNIFISIVRRLKHYDSSLLNLMVEECLKREIKEFRDPSSEFNPYRSIDLPGLFNMLHCLATFNERNTKFMIYILNILQLITKKECSQVKSHLQITDNPKNNRKQLPINQKQDKQMQNPKQNKKQTKKQDNKKQTKDKHTQEQSEIGLDTFSRVLWSLCILCPPQQLIQLYPLIDKYFQRINELSDGNCLNFYYGYLYLREALPKLQTYKNPLMEYLSTTSFTTRTSKTQTQICQQLVKLGVPAIPQFNLHNISCDIFIPIYQEIENIVIDIHGFHHFTRNEKRLLGGNFLKMKLLDQERYKFQFISLDEWLVVEDKSQFISQFVSWIKNKYGDKKNSKSSSSPSINVGKTAVFSSAKQPQQQKVRQPIQLREVQLQFEDKPEKTEQQIVEQAGQAKRSGRGRGRNTRSKLVI